MQRSLMATLVLGTVALFGTVAAKAAPQYDDRYYGGGQVVRCDSNDNRYRECRMDTRGGVRLVRQISKTRCEEGRNWGRLRDGVWVDRGCRAEFASGRGGGWDSPQRIRCESIDGRSRSCPVNGRGEVRLVRQFSKAPYSEGYSWGRDRNAIWVSRGCRAEFEVYGRGHGWNNGGYDNGYGDGYGRTFRCESEKGRTRTCGVDGRGRGQHRARLGVGHRRLPGRVPQLVILRM